MFQHESRFHSHSILLESHGSGSSSPKLHFDIQQTLGAIDVPRISGRQACLILGAAIVFLDQCGLSPAGQTKDR